MRGLYTSLLKELGHNNGKDKETAITIWSVGQRNILGSRC